MEKVNYISSMVIGLLVKLNDKILSYGGKLALSNVNSAIVEVSKITGVNTTIHIFDNLQEAETYVLS